MQYAPQEFSPKSWPQTYKAVLTLQEYFLLPSTPGRSTGFITHQGMVSLINSAEFERAALHLVYQQNLNEIFRLT